jgi:hypothetical protein
VTIPLDAQWLHHTAQHATIHITDYEIKQISVSLSNRKRERLLISWRDYAGSCEDGNEHFGRKKDKKEGICSFELVMELLHQV